MTGLPGNPATLSNEARLLALESAVSAPPSVAAGDAVIGATGTTSARTVSTTLKPGLYLVLVSLRVVTAWAVGTVAGSIAWTDDSQAQTRTLYTGFTLTAKGEQNAMAFVYVKQGAFTWTTTVTGGVTPGTYNTSIKIVRL